MTILFCLKKSIKAQIKNQKLKLPRSIERNLNRSTNGSRARKCHTNIFPSFDLFFWKSLSYGHFVRCSNTAMMNQCFGNISASGVPLASSFDLLNCCFAATNWNFSLLTERYLAHRSAFLVFCETTTKFDSQKTTEISVPKRNS